MHPALQCRSEGWQTQLKQHLQRQSSRVSSKGGSKEGILPYLQGCASEQEAVGCNVVGVEDLRQLTVMVLHAVALVDDHVLPTKLEKQTRAGDTSCKSEAITANSVMSITLHTFDSYFVR